MNLESLIQADGIEAKKVASTNGGEYHSPCPGCGGEDRFIFWDKQERYFCRKCQKRGDAIQYLRDFHSLSYGEACKKLGEIPQKTNRSSISPAPKQFQPHEIVFPPLLWQSEAAKFIHFCNERLLASPQALSLLFQRGFTITTIKKFKLGWQEKTEWLNRAAWGLTDPENKKLWLPRGIVIPTFHPGTQMLLKIKVRRSDWHEKDNMPKYVEISGSAKCFSILGNKAPQIMVLESELDAILIQQEAGDLCLSMATGGSTRYPDQCSHQLLRQIDQILFAFDVDQAGVTACRWWRQTYPQLKIWVSPICKSPGDAHINGINLRSWVLAGISSSQQREKGNEK